MALKLQQISWFFSTLFGDELFGSEGIKQVFGLLTDFFDNLKDKDAVTHLLYDDMCHLKRHSENPEVAELNEVTEKISKLEKYVDKVSSFFKYVVSIWALPLRGVRRGGVNACPDD